MAKQYLLLLPLLFCSFLLTAQIKDNIRLGVETGLLRSADTVQVGIFLNIEPKLKVYERTYIGLRVGATINSHTFENFNNRLFLIDSRGDNGVISVIPTIDYYFDKGDLQPYVGLGVGAIFLAANVEVIRVNKIDPYDNPIIANVDNKIGLLLRTGLESGRTRLGLEYNYIPTADIVLPSGATVGTVSNSFFALSLGFIFGEN